MHIAPLATRVVFIVCLAGAVDATHLVGSLVLRHTIFFHAPPYLVIGVAVTKHPDHAGKIVEYIIGTPAHYHTTALGRNVAYHMALGHE